MHKTQKAGRSSKANNNVMLMAESTILENIDYDPTRNIDKNQIQRFNSCDFVKQKGNILVTRSRGAGKSYMALVIGHQACSLGY